MGTVTKLTYPKNHPKYGHQRTNGKRLGWQLRWMSPTEKSKRVSTTFWGSAKAAHDELDRLEAGSALGLSDDYDIRNLTVGELRLKAVEDFQWSERPTGERPGVLRTTSTYSKFVAMMQVVKRDPQLDDMLVWAVTHEDISNFLSRYRVNGGQEPTAETLLTLESQVRKLFRYAVDWGVIIPSRDPTARRRGAAKVNTGKKVTWAPSIADIDLVAANLAEKHDYLADMLYVLYRTGLRIEEACGLKVHNVDFDRNSITIVETVTVSGGVRQEGGTKSVASTRTIPIHGKVKDPLKRLCDRASLPKYRCEFVFMGEGRRSRLPSEMEKRRSDRARHAISYSTWRSSLKEAVDKAVEEHGIRRFTSHTLRHAAIANLLAAGYSDSEVTSFAGHGSERIVRNRYDSLIERDLTAEADAMTKRLGDR
jgi:integrase